jgi:hypothetical protein
MSDENTSVKQPDTSRFGRPRKNRFSEEEMKSPFIQRYVLSLEDKKVEYKQKRIKRLIEDIERMEEGKVLDPKEQLAIKRRTTKYLFPPKEEN